jgi:TolB-like protein/Flp pilus assembly protein TadD
MAWTKSQAESLKRAVEFTKKALTLNPEYSLAHSLQGAIYLFQRQYDKAIAEGQRAISIDPNYADGYALLSQTMCYSGRFEEALALIKKAMRLCPIPRVFYPLTLGRAYNDLERYEKAIPVFEQLQERCRRGECPPSVPSWFIILSYMGLGREEEARAEAEELLRLKPGASLEGLRKTQPYKDPAHLERWISALRKAGLPEHPPLPLPDKPSIAVLPFVNMSGDPEQEYLGDGFTEEIITALSKTPKLFVIARTSSFRYKGKEVDVRMVGRELGVRYVLEGSVRRSKDELRITAQLVDAKTGNHLWAERYDRELKDAFAVQDEITKKIITELQVKLTVGEQARFRAKGTENLQAYLKYLRAREYFFHFTPDDNTRARKLLKEVIAMDPNYSPPYVFLGYTHLQDVFYATIESPRQSVRNAMKLAQKAIAIDQNNPGAHRLLGHIYMITRRHDKAIAEGEKALKLDPNSADVYVKLGQFLFTAGKPEEGILSIERGIRLNPFPPSWYFHLLASAYRTTGRYEEAIKAGKKAIEIEPKDLFAWVHLAASYSLLGRLEEASAAAKEIHQINPKFCIEPEKTIYKNQADMERLRNALRKAGLPDCPPRRSSK